MRGIEEILRVVKWEFNNPTRLIGNMRNCYLKLGSYNGLCGVIGAAVELDLVTRDEYKLFKEYMYKSVVLGRKQFWGIDPYTEDFHKCKDNTKFVWYPARKYPRNNWLDKHIELAMNRGNLIQLWLDAEEENRKHTEEGNTKCLALKDAFSTVYKTLSIEEQKDIDEELDSFGA